MNQCVPDFETPMDDQNMPSSSSSSGLARQKKPSIADEDIVELLWQNGQIVTQNQNHRQFRKSPPARNTDESPSSARPEVENYNQFLFLQEGEMASWLHYPIQDLDQNFSTDFLNSPPPINNNSSMQTLPRTSQLTELRQPPMSVAPPRPPIPPPNFACFSRNGARAEPISRTTARESTVVDSCDTPAFPPPVISETARSSAEPTEGGVAAPSTTFDCEPGGSSSSGEPVQKVEKQDRKRKGREVEEWEYQSEDVYFESAEAKKNVVGSTSTKRSRAAEVHNLSERRRRDRINEKMRALQELIPRCNKSDKASMLDEAIEYLKSLQLQVQKLST